MKCNKVSLKCPSHTHTHTRLDEPVSMLKEQRDLKQGHQKTAFPVKALKELEFGLFLIGFVCFSLTQVEVRGEPVLLHMEGVLLVATPPFPLQVFLVWSRADPGQAGCHLLGPSVLLADLEGVQEVWASSTRQLLLIAPARDGLLHGGGAAFNSDFCVGV